MSLFFGMIALRGTEPMDARLAAVSRLFDGYPGSTVQQWRGVHAGLLYRGQANTPQSAFESQPLEFSDGSDTYHLLADVRLDNRRELIANLKQHPLINDRRHEELGDDRLLLAAYLTWGAAAPERLLGDFSFVVHHERARQVFLARDQLGAKNLYFSQQGHCLFFANLPNAFMVLPKFDLTLNPEALAGFIATGALLSERLTFYRALSRLPAACTRLIGDGMAHEERYWQPQDSPQLTFASDSDAVSALKSLLEDAVAVRMQTVHPMGTHLSGGLDSAAVSRIASRLNGPDGKPLTGFSWVSVSETGEDFKEWSNAKRLADEFNIPLQGLQLKPQDVLDHLLAMDITCLDTSDAWYESGLLSQASGQGIRTVLSGWGGDELISYHGRKAVIDQLLAFKLRWVGQELLSAGRGKGAFPVRVLKAVVREIVRPMFDCLRVTIGTPGLAAARSELNGYHPRINEAQGWRDWVYEGAALFVREEQTELLEQGHLQVRMESWANAGKRFGIDYRYPLLDRRVVEFALGLPATFYQRNGVRRWIFRQVMSDELPAWLITGNWKMEPERVKALVHAVIDVREQWFTQSDRLSHWAVLSDGNAVLSPSQLQQRLQAVAAQDVQSLPDQVRRVQSLLTAASTGQAGWRHGRPG